jgi:hypothetical protein
MLWRHRTVIVPFTTSITTMMLNPNPNQASRQALAMPSVLWTAARQVTDRMAHRR